MLSHPEPNRREQIIDAAYASIAENGVAGTSHRGVAARCGVSLGTITYHFSGIDALILEAFSLYARRIADLVRNRLDRPMDRAAAIDAVVDLIHIDFHADQTDYNVTYELYALASRQPALRELVHDLIGVGLRSLGRHFDEPQARAINTYIEGASTHLALDTQQQTPEQTRNALQKLAA